MPTQYPVLSQEEQTIRWKRMAGKNLFPYTYLTSQSVDTTQFSRVGANSFRYFTLPFQSDNNSAVSILEVSSSTIPLRGFDTSDDHRTIFNVQVSYSPAINTEVNAYTATVAPSTPIDSGNVIYNVFDSTRTDANTASPPPFFVLTGDPFNFYHFHRFQPYNYLLKFNQILYIHVGFLNDAHVISGAGSLEITCILHMLNTGLKT